ncbi:MAG: ABC transporter permease [Thermoplasmata archaeon]|nr:ABC transporter permease [Thermoplasmata archaeon]MCK5397467.1 ABC transporter permease [Thermoplasmata archaeon]
MSEKAIVPVKTSMSFRGKLDFVRAMYTRHYYLWMRFKISAIVGTISSIVAILSFFFLNYVIQPDATYFAEYGGDFFTFVLIGVAFFAYANVCLIAVRSVISETYFNNWLEIILSSPVKFYNYLIVVLIRALISSTLNILFYILVGVSLLGAIIAVPSNIFILITVLLLAILSISGLGLISASTFLLLDVKGGAEPVNWFFATFAGLVSGSFFPPEVYLEVFPPMYYLSRIFPHTYALDAFRRLLNPAMNQATDMPIIMNDIFMLLIFTVIFLSIGIFLFRKGMHKAERDGNLAKWGA